MKQEIKIGKTDHTDLVFIADPAQTDGSGKTGLVAANLTVSYVRVETDNDVTVTDVTSSLNNLASLVAAHNDWGLLEVSATLAPGLYRLDMADAVFATGAWSAVVYVVITSSLAAPAPMEYVMVPSLPYDGVNVDAWDGGTVSNTADTQLPKVAMMDINNDIGGTAITNCANFFTATGYVGGTAKLTVDAVKLLGTAIATPATAGLLDVNVKQISTDATAADQAEAFFDGTGYAGTNNVIPSVTTVTGNVNGSVASVTGAVGSVTGAVGSVTAGVTLAASALAAIWDRLTSALTTAGSIGKLIVDYLDAAISSRLAPTVAARTLDVTLTGAAGVDWGNVENQTTVVGLTNTTVGSGGALTAQQVWEYATRTLTTTAQTITAAIAGTSVTIQRGDTLSLSITGLGAIAAGDELWFTVKGFPISEDDTKAALQINRTTGLIYINGEVAATAANGSITVTDATAGNITIALTAAESAKLPIILGEYDVQRKTAAGAYSTMTQGIARIAHDVTRRV